MKSLSLTSPLVITIIGHPGSGKSFFARQFAEMFGAPLVSPDFLRHSLVPESSYSQEEDDAIHALSLYMLEELLKTKKTILLDGGANTRATRQEIKRLTSKHGYGYLVVWVQTDEPTSRGRATKRSAKRAGDALNSSMDSDTFTSLAKQLAPPHHSESSIVISGKHTFATQARVVLKKLVKPRDETPLDSQANAHVHAKSSPISSHDIRPNRRGINVSQG
jgi:predicted kinase